MTGGEAKNKGLLRRIRQHVIAQEHDFFAIVQPGFEETARLELEEICAGKISSVSEGGIEFRSRLEGCYRVNLASRTVSRVLMRLARFRARHFDEYGRKCAQVPWELHVADGARLSFHISASRGLLYHTGRLKEELSRAVIQRLAEHGISAAPGAKEEEKASQILFLRVEGDRCRISLDASGDLLYKRGYKTHITEATLRETLAALILREARVRDYDFCLDPMCGSGTFSLEAAGIYQGRLPGTARTFRFMDWPGFKPASYQHLVKSLGAEKTDPVPGPRIFAGDVDSRAVEAAKSNVEAAGLSSYIELEQRDFFQDRIGPAVGRGLIVLNPPYGKRLDTDGAGTVFRRIGRVIRESYPAYGYAIITPGLESEKILSLPYDRKVLFMNGGLRVAVLFKDAGF